ncbi:MAG: hypothetical protein ACTSSB_08480, partial [Candidatus Heimdallarchaeota archaeon]
MSYKEETNSNNMFFKSAIVVALLGVMLYFIQEIVLWANMYGMDPPQYGFRLLTMICDGIMIIAIILIVVFILIGKDKKTILRIAVLTGALYLFAYAFSLFFYPFFNYGDWELYNDYIAAGYNILDFYQYFSGASFISLLLTCAYSIYLIVLASMSFGKEEITILESFSLILLFGLLFVFDNANVHLPRAFLFYTGLPISYYGFFMIPIFVEMILLVAGIVLLTLQLTNNAEKISKLLGIVFINIFFIAMISTTVISAGFVFEEPDLVPFAIGSILICIGTLLIM